MGFETKVFMTFVLKCYLESGSGSLQLEPYIEIRGLLKEGAHSQVFKE